MRYETDVYGGYRFAPAALRLDLGFIHYRFPDAFTLSAAHTREFFGGDAPGTYLAAAVEQPVNEQVTATATATAGAGYSRGAGVDAIVGRTYWDYGLALATAADALGPGRWRLALQGTDLERDEIDGSERRLVLDWLLEFAP